MKSDQSLRDLKNKKNMKSFLKKLSNGNRFFSKIPYETRTSLFHLLSSIRNSELILFVALNVTLN